MASGTVGGGLGPFDVPRQIIDDSEHFGGLLLVVLADHSLVGDETKRSLDAYVALKMRVWSDVRPEGRGNPLAPLVILAEQPTAGNINSAAMR